MTSAPRRLLLLRPDTYGDLFLFEPVLRILRQAWPQTEIAVLIRERYADIVPLINSVGVRWLTTTCDPYRHHPGDDRAALDALRDTAETFAPDCVVAVCTEQTWLEAAVATFLPAARRVTAASGPVDPTVRPALAEVLSLDGAEFYPEVITVDPGTPEWDKNLRVASALLGGEAPCWWPIAAAPEDARERARQILADAGLPEGGFAACAAAGIANVQIKAWPAAKYGEILAWLEQTRGMPALLIGHVSERPRLEAVREAARAHGGAPALWTGQDGEMPVTGALLEKARLFFGNDTGALHLAAALGRPVASIFGGGTWPRFRPTAVRELTIVQPLPCFGCAWECDYGDAPCLQTISVESVRQALAAFLSDDAPERTVYEASGLEAGARALIEAATPRLRFLRGDRADRLRQVEELGALLKASEADRADRLRQVEELTTMYHASETDRADGWRQIEELTTLLKASEADRADRLRQVEELTDLLKLSEADRTARWHQIEELTGLLKVSEADRGERLKHMEKLTMLLQEAQRGGEEYPAVGPVEADVLEEGSRAASVAGVLPGSLSA